MARDRDDRDDDDDRPARRGGGGGGEKIPNHLVKAILVTLFCCLPLGIVAIINAAKVDGLAAKGQYSEAREASEQANKWGTYGLIGGLVINGLIIGFYVVIIVLAVGAGAAGGGGLK